MTAEELIAKLGTEQKTHISHGGGTMEYCFKIVGKRPANGKYPVCILYGIGQTMLRFRSLKPVLALKFAENLILIIMRLCF